MNKLLCLLLFITLPMAAQERKPLLGRVMAGTDAAANVFVINKKARTETKTDAAGNFTIDAKVGDVITVYSNKTEVRDFVINDLAFKDNPYVLSVKVTAYELDEVVINDVGVTSESLGLVPKNQKRYTPAQRRLKTASEIKPSFFLGYMPGIGLPTDAIINAISGRTKMLKKALVTENKEFALDKINGLYTDQEISDDLHIPEEYIQGFIYYAVEDAGCAAALKAKNDDLAKLTIANLALKYLDILKEHE
jgi:hypothetical protein